MYIDDILITGHTESEHVANVEKVLERLSLAGMKLRREKCIFMAPEVQYLEHKGIPTLASCRIQRWALISGSYNYSVKYCPGQELANADALSRLPIPLTEEPSSPSAELIALVNHLESIPLTVTDLRKSTEKDQYYQE